MYRLLACFLLCLGCTVPKTQTTVDYLYHHRQHWCLDLHVSGHTCYRTIKQCQEQEHESRYVPREQIARSTCHVENYYQE